MSWCWGVDERRGRRSRGVQSLVSTSMPVGEKLGWKSCLLVSRESRGLRAFWNSHSRKTISFYFPHMFSLGSTLQD